MQDDELVAQLLETAGEVLQAVVIASRHTALDDNDLLCVERLVSLVAEYDLRGLSALTDGQIWWLHEVFEAIDDVLTPLQHNQQ